MYFTELQTIFQSDVGQKSCTLTVRLQNQLCCWNEKPITGFEQLHSARPLVEM